MIQKIIYLVEKQTNAVLVTIALGLNLMCCTTSINSEITNEKILFEKKQEKKDKEELLYCFPDFSVFHKNSDTKLSFKEELLNPKIANTVIIDKVIGLNQVTYCLNKEFEIYHKFRNDYSDSKWFAQDSLSVLGYEINITEFFKKNGYPIDYVESYIVNLFSFNYNSNVFLLIFLKDMKGQGKSDPKMWPLLFDITNKERIKATVLGESGRCYRTGIMAQYYPDFLGDYNKDGNLDYLYWTYGLDTIKYFTIDHSLNTHLVDSVYFKVKSVPIDEVQFSQESYNFYLDVLKSNWFYPLNREIDIDIITVGKCPANVYPNQKSIYKNNIGYIYPEYRK